MTREPADESYMDQALALAELGRGQTSPNPMVGAVLVSDDGVVIGTGYHHRAGEPHAEVLALDRAGRGARGGTLYCTLEPCNHHGRTGPCTERIVAAGVRRVVVAAVDPNPHVSGGGIEHLRDHGVSVDVGVRQAAAHRLNEAFFMWTARGRPFVTMKIAVSRDRKIAARPGAQTSLTSAVANREVHRARAEVDALAVGSTTVLVDDPKLTVRGIPRTRPLTRVVFDRRLRTPATARLFRTLDQGPVVIVTTDGAVTRQPGVAEALRAAGARLEVLPDDAAAIDQGLHRLGALNLTSLIIEGGVTIHRAIWRARLVDRVQVFVAPVVLGPEAVPWLELPMTELGDQRVRRYGPDTLTEGYVQRLD